MTLPVALALALAAAAPRALPRPAPDPAPAAELKLLPGAEGPLCLDCHPQFDEVLARPFVHTPVKARRCASCHLPHTSANRKFLAAEGSAVCAACHPGIVPQRPRSTHAPVAAGDCTRCHDPHAGDAPFMLAKRGNALCGSCHARVVGTAARRKTPHRPVAKACTACHDPHGSAASPSLLRVEVPGLCLGCHDARAAAFSRAHLGYPVAKGRCTSCHDAHGSDRRAMLYETIHSPVGRRMCAQCHLPATSPSALTTRVPPPQLCRACHSRRLAEIMDRPRLHAPVAAGTCLACHGPHATREPGLLPGGPIAVCGRCHADTIARQALSPTRHGPVRDGQCTRCHDPHSSDAPLALLKADVVEACGSCHDWQTHSSHPMGPGVPDPRNRNLTVQCLSCHRAHGTEYRHLVPYPTTTALCVECHAKPRR